MVRFNLIEAKRRGYRALLFNGYIIKFISDLQREKSMARSNNQYGLRNAFPAARALWYLLQRWYRPKGDPYAVSLFVITDGPFHSLSLGGLLSRGRHDIWGRLWKRRATQTHEWKGIPRRWVPIEGLLRQAFHLWLQLKRPLGNYVMHLGRQSDVFESFSIGGHCIVLISQARNELPSQTWQSQHRQSG